MSRVSNVNTTSIPDAISLGCRTMCNVFDADDNDTPFFISEVWPEPHFGFFALFSDTHVPGRHLYALLSAEDAVGVEMDEECINKHARAMYRSFSGPVALPLNRPEQHADRTLFVAHNCREALFALYALARHRDSQKAVETAEEFLAAIDEYWDREAGWDTERLEREHGVETHEEFTTFIPIMGRAIGALVSLYGATGLDGALELARTCVRKAMDESFPADGSYDVDRLCEHCHSVTCTLSGLAHFAELTDDDALMERVYKFYSNGLWELRDKLGWCTEGDRPEPSDFPDMGEANNTGDILETALILGRWGRVEAYEDAERILRGHLLPSQLRDVSFVEEPPNPDGVDALRDVGDRNLGAYGFAAPYGHRALGLGCAIFYLDIVGGAVSSLCKAYRHIIRREGDTRRVELLFDHQAEGLTVRSPYTDDLDPPEEGVLELRADYPGPLMVRIPPWVPQGELRLHGQPRAPQDGYLHIQDPSVGEWLRVEFPLVERGIVLHHENHDIRVRLRGDAVVAMDNFGADLTFFPPLPGLRMISSVPHAGAPTPAAGPACGS
ncbi:MAG: hypothetical protein R6V05_00205 [Candidatus Brocadiia bacterium]